MNALVENTALQMMAHLHPLAMCINGRQGMGWGGVGEPPCTLSEPCRRERRCPCAPVTLKSPTRVVPANIVRPRHRPNASAGTKEPAATLASDKPLGLYCRWENGSYALKREIPGSLKSDIGIVEALVECKALTRHARRTRGQGRAPACLGAPCPGRRLRSSPMVPQPSRGRLLPPRHP